MVKYSESLSAIVFLIFSSCYVFTCISCSRRFVNKYLYSSFSRHAYFTFFSDSILSSIIFFKLKSNSFNKASFNPSYFSCHCTNDSLLFTFSFIYYKYDITLLLTTSKQFYWFMIILN